MGLDAVRVGLDAVRVGLDATEGGGMGLGFIGFSSLKCLSLFVGRLSQRLSANRSDIDPGEVRPIIGVSCTCLIHPSLPLSLPPSPPASPPSSSFLLLSCVASFYYLVPPFL